MAFYVHKLVEAQVAEYLQSRHPSDAPKPLDMALLIQELQLEVEYARVATGSAIRNLSEELDRVRQPV